VSDIAVAFVLGFSLGAAVLPTAVVSLLWLYKRLGWIAMTDDRAKAEGVSDE
jgi:hypothetical protein